MRNLRDLVAVREELRLSRLRTACATGNFPGKAGDNARILEPEDLPVMRTVGHAELAHTGLDSYG